MQKTNELFLERERGQIVGGSRDNAGFGSGCVVGKSMTWKGLGQRKGDKNEVDNELCDDASVQVHECPVTVSA